MNTKTYSLTGIMVGNKQVEFDLDGMKAIWHGMSDEVAASLAKCIHGGGFVEITIPDRDEIARVFNIDLGGEDK
jgi:hypothetical protein